MSARARVALLATLAALVPLQAFAGGSSAPSSLSVSASLGGCGVGQSGVTCQINAAYSGVAGAEYYTASVTSANGSVSDFGTVGTGEGGGSAAVWVPYVGAGVYSVRITAWGTPPGAEEPEIVDTDEDAADGNSPESGDSDEAAEATADVIATDENHSPDELEDYTDPTDQPETEEVPPGEEVPEGIDGESGEVGADGETTDTPVDPDDPGVDEEPVDPVDPAPEDPPVIEPAPEDANTTCEPSAEEPSEEATELEPETATAC